MRDTILDGAIQLPALATPWQQATLATRLLGTVTHVDVHVGDRVRSGQVLATIDARDLDARATQADAALAAAAATRDEARLAVTRLRALVADDAAPRAQLDAADAALARAEGAHASALGTQRELAAARSYATVRAPFTGIVVARHVDPGAFAAPGTALVSLADDHALRLTARVAPSQLRTIARGATVKAEIDGTSVLATIDGLAPAPDGGPWTIVARVANDDRALPAGGTARLHLPTARVRALVVPERALVRDGDLEGVRVPAAGAVERRWLRLGLRVGEAREVLGGLQAGDTILVPRVLAGRP
ncbi:MAG: efflux RND transporter periplasmic adaptor subunit [Gemmatimonadaceae bacterium]|nr:efflux RND transporter periplasmic adaptor subunit [Gemmatimonadaceae bacterium]